MRVNFVDYDDQTTLRIRLSERPDMDVLRQYVTVEPLASGSLAFRCETPYANGEKKPLTDLFVTGDYAHRTNVTLRIRKGFPVYGRTSTSNLVVDALQEDYTYTFTRKDREPSVGFTHTGRYLPPVGSRSLSLTCVNVPSVRVDVHRVAPVSIVPLLVLEERAYAHIHATGTWDGKEEFVEDFAQGAWSVTNRLDNALNAEEQSLVSLVPPSGVASNGIFFATALRADAERDEDGFSYDAELGRWTYHPEKLNRKQFRVVCVTDLGLSVRVLAEGLGVWVTSLTKGAPVAGAVVEAYSKANVLVAKGVSDESGWCRTERVASGQPFAVIVRTADESDMTFLALGKHRVQEEAPDGAWGEDYLKPAACEAFVWTERGIYRHDEKIFLQAILRDGTGVAPKPFPLEVEFLNPSYDTYAVRTLMPDADGVVTDDSLSVPDDQPSGSWTIRVRTPGKQGICLGSRSVKVEEFAPPQIRVKVSATAEKPQTFAFDVSAEHLYGGPAKALRSEGAVVFEDVPFAPKGWQGYAFGDDGRGLKPNFRRLEKSVLDDRGVCSFAAPIWADSGLPKAAVKATGQGTVFEDGGRPATARKSVVCHYYPYYIGTTLTGWVKRPQAGFPKVALACVAPDGSRLGEAKRLEVKIDRIDSVYSYKRNGSGWATWTCDRVRKAVVEEMTVVTKVGEDTEVALPLETCGDYAIAIRDPETDVSFGREFYLSDWGDETVRAPLGNPTKVALTADKSSYRVGETPRLVVKSPFAGSALLTVTRDDLVYAEVLTLTNATSEISLRPVAADWAPNVSVQLSVIQSVAANERRMAVRAHGETMVSVRPLECEIPLKLAVTNETARSGQGSTLKVSLAAPGATRATVTVVDEGINLLTDEQTPDPIGWFGRLRMSDLALYDIYQNVLPVLGEDVLKANGVKTGGGAGAELLGRVSPVPTRRFKPLALWQADVPVTDGQAEVTFALPEFVGEVRVTAVARSASATGAASVRQKVVPKLVMQPDAPRFVAPRDAFEVSLPIVNRSGAAGDVGYRVSGGTRTVLDGTLRLAAGESTVLRATVTAPAEPGQLSVAYAVSGFGEAHEVVLEVPVRPAVAWRETAGVQVLQPGESWTLKGPKTTARVSGTPLAELRRALAWLADYPHGCLEQTTSRIFPLIAADGLLAEQSPVTAEKRRDYIAAGVARVSSMIRQNDFVMWPDANYAPWDPEVSLYASHFLLAAEKGGVTLNRSAKDQVLRFLKKWAVSPTNSVSAYACHDLALAGRADKDRMLALYDNRRNLALLDRARLARAFVATGDRMRAEELLKNAASPDSVKEAAFLTLALLELDPEDRRLPALVTYLQAKRDRTCYSWGTTESNAHALLALGAYYRWHPVKEGKAEVRRVEGDGTTFVNTGKVPAFVDWAALELPAVETVTNETTALEISRTFRTPEGALADLSSLSRGDLLVVELKIRSAETRDYADLVIEDLFAGACEPVRGGIDLGNCAWIPGKDRFDHWVMRSDARDDRMLVFSRKFHLNAGEEVVHYYQVRVVSAGDFTLPGVAVEAMYQPELRARTGVSRLVVRP